jgi:hypothetical protein
MQQPAHARTIEVTLPPPQCGQCRSQCGRVLHATSGPGGCQCAGIHSRSFSVSISRVY